MKKNMSFRSSQSSSRGNQPQEDSDDDLSNRQSETMLLDDILSDAPEYIQPSELSRSNVVSHVSPLMSPSRHFSEDSNEACVSPDSSIVNSGRVNHDTDGLGSEEFCHDHGIDVQSFASNPVVVALNFDHANISEPPTNSSIPSADDEQGEETQDEDEGKSGSDENTKKYAQRQSSRSTHFVRDENQSLMTYLAPRKSGLVHVEQSASTIASHSSNPGTPMLKSTKQKKNISAHSTLRGISTTTTSSNDSPHRRQHSFSDDPYSHSQNVESPKNDSPVSLQNRQCSEDNDEDIGNTINTDDTSDTDEQVQDQDHDYDHNQKQSSESDDEDTELSLRYGSSTFSQEEIGDKIRSGAGSPLNLNSSSLVTSYTHHSSPSPLVLSNIVSPNSSKTSISSGQTQESTDILTPLHPPPFLPLPAITSTSSTLGELIQSDMESESKQSIESIDHLDNIRDIAQTQVQHQPESQPQVQKQKQKPHPPHSNVGAPQQMQTQMQISSAPKPPSRPTSRPSSRPTSCPTSRPTSRPPSPSSGLGKLTTHSRHSSTSSEGFTFAENREMTAPPPIPTRSRKPSYSQVAAGVGSDGIEISKDTTVHVVKNTGSNNVTPSSSTSTSVSTGTTSIGHSSPQRFSSPTSDFILSCADNFFSIEGTLRRRKTLFNMWKNPQFFSVSLMLIPAPPSEFRLDEPSQSGLRQNHGAIVTPSASTSPSLSLSTDANLTSQDSIVPSAPSSPVYNVGNTSTALNRLALSPPVSPTSLGTKIGPESPTHSSLSPSLVPQMKVSAAVRVFNKKPLNRAEWSRPDESYMFLDTPSAMVTAVSPICEEHRMLAFSLRMRGDRVLLLGFPSQIEAESWHVAFSHIYSSLAKAARMEIPVLTALPPGNYLSHLRALAPGEIATKPSRDRAPSGSQAIEKQRALSHSSDASGDFSIMNNQLQTSGSGISASSTTGQMQVQTQSGNHRPKSPPPNILSPTSAQAHALAQGQAYNQSGSGSEKVIQEAANPAADVMQSIGNTFSSFFRKVIPTTNYSGAPIPTPASLSTGSSTIPPVKVPTTVVTSGSQPTSSAALVTTSAAVVSSENSIGKEDKTGSIEVTTSTAPTVSTLSSSGSLEDSVNIDINTSAASTSTEIDSWSSWPSLLPTRHKFGKDDKERLSVPALDTLGLTFTPMTTINLPFSSSTAFALLLSSKAPGDVAHFHKYRGDDPASMTLSSWFLQRDSKDIPSNTEVVDTLPVNPPGPTQWSSFLSRDFQVTIPVSGAPGISSSRLNKTQRVVGVAGADGTLSGMILDCTSNTPDVTFGTNFAIVERWVFSDAPNGESCTLEMTSSIYYASKPFTMRAFSGMIEGRGKSDTKGICEDYGKFVLTELPKLHPDALSWAKKVSPPHSIPLISPSLPLPIVSSEVGSLATELPVLSGIDRVCTDVNNSKSTSGIARTTTGTVMLSAEEIREEANEAELADAPSFLDAPSLGAAMAWIQGPGGFRVCLLLGAIFALWIALAILGSIVGMIFGTTPSLGFPAQLAVLALIAIESGSANAKQRASVKLQTRVIKRLEQHIASLERSIDVLQEKVNANNESSVKILPTWVESNS